MTPKRAFRFVVLAAVLVVGAWFAFSTAGRPGPQAFSLSGSASGNAGGAPAGNTASPVVVRLKDVPPGQLDPNNQFDRWQRGEIEIERSESIIDRARMEDLKVAAMDLAPSTNVTTGGPASSAPASVTGFDSIDYNECCGGGGNVPPDPELAVGPNHVIAVVNAAFEIYNKNGTSLYGPTTFSSFMASNASCTGVFDPNAVYDESADRYILGIDADGKGYCLAVSKTGDPTGEWYIYYFSTLSNQRDFFDYPHLGVGRDALYMGANIFGVRTFKEARVWAFDKAAMYAGGTASSVNRGLATSEDTPQPLNLHGWNQGTWPTSGPHYFFTETNYNGATYSVFAWNDPFGANSFTKVGTVDLVAATGVAAGMPVDVPQLGGQTLQGNDFRPQDFEYRNGFAWSSQTISCNPGGGTVNCVRWVKIDPATATVVDAGVYGSSGEYRVFADLAVDDCENLGIGYSKSSSSMYPAAYVASGSPLSETLLKAGEIAYTSFETSAPRRWGDYTEMTIDPAGTTFWYLGEYSKNTGTTNGRWGTYIGSFSLGCNSGGSTNAAPVVSITSPSNGANFASGTSIAFAGTATDDNDENLTGSLVWKSDGQTIGSGGSFNTTLSDGTHTITASATDTGNLTGSASVTITVGDPQPANSMHVSAIDMTAIKKGKSVDLRTTVTIVDANNLPVLGATVSISLEVPGGGTATGSTTTNSQGQVTFSYKPASSGLYTATVTSVSLSGYTYNSGANVENWDTYTVP